MGGEEEGSVINGVPMSPTTMCPAHYSLKSVGRIITCALCSHRATGGAQLATSNGVNYLPENVPEFSAVLMSFSMEKSTCEEFPTRRKFEPLTAALFVENESAVFIPHLPIIWVLQSDFNCSCLFIPL